MVKKKVLLNQLSLLKREVDLKIVLPFQGDVALAINMAIINMTDKVMLILAGINRCYNGGYDSKERGLWGCFVLTRTWKSGEFIAL